MNSSVITEKMVLGTVQFGMDYGIANVSGKPSIKEVFDILDLAWEKGVRKYDTAPGYGSELILGEFILTNGLQNEVKIMTKIPSLVGHPDYQAVTKNSIELSLENLGCPIETLFFHDPEDSGLLQKNSHFFENMLSVYPVSTLGVSVYEPQEVDDLIGRPFELAFQFPFNVLDRRFEQINMPLGKRYARSIFLQGLLASPNGLRANAPHELLSIQNNYHQILVTHDINPIDFVISFVANNDAIDYFLVGVETKHQITHILNTDSNKSQDTNIIDNFALNFEKDLFDPRKWN
jgi:aryl-alcohol dehydrogenase-like predicted oxidoreductase